MNKDLNNIFPLIVPATYYSKKVWDLPHYKLSHPSFILTWVEFGSSATMEYLTQDNYHYLNNIYHNWQQKSFENLRKSIADHENFFTQYMLSDDEQRVNILAFMNCDGVGSGRILFSNELTKAFPQGYYVAFPDRSCGLVIAKDATEKELREAKKLVRSMFKDAVTPMSGELHQAEDFTIPNSWITPKDIEFSNMLVNEILKLQPSIL